MRFWIPFDSDPVEKSSFRRSDAYDLPNGGIGLHIVDSGINFRRREVDPSFFGGFGYAGVSFSFLCIHGVRRSRINMLRGVKLHRVKG